MRFRDRQAGRPAAVRGARRSGIRPGAIGAYRNRADVLTAAAAEARARHHNVRPEHLILGPLAQPQELAAEVLAGGHEQVKQRLGTRPPRPA
jgi:hypothetical protein